MKLENKEQIALERKVDRVRTRDICLTGAMLSKIIPL